MDLHESLKVEEGLRDGELVIAPTCREEVLKLITVGQFQDDFIYLTEGLRVDILKVLSLQDSLKEELANLAHVRVLQGHL